MLIRQHNPPSFEFEFQTYLNGGFCYIGNMQIVVRYPAKLGCANCGMADFYELPRGEEFLAYDNEDNTDIGDHLYSRTRPGINEKEAAERPVNCRNCGMPFLVLVEWNKSDMPTVGLKRQR